MHIILKRVDRHEASEKLTEGTSFLRHLLWGSNSALLVQVQLLRRRPAAAPNQLVDSSSSSISRTSGSTRSHGPSTGSILRMKEGCLGACHDAAAPKRSPPTRSLSCKRHCKSMSLLQCKSSACVPVVIQAPAEFLRRAPVEFLRVRSKGGTILARGSCRHTSMRARAHRLTLVRSCERVGTRRHPTCSILRPSADCNAAVRRASGSQNEESCEYSL